MLMVGTAHARLCDMAQQCLRLCPPYDSLPLTTGRPAMSSGYGHSADFGTRVGWYGEPMIAPIRQNGANGLFGIGKRFLLRVAFRDNFRKRRHQHGEAATFLWLQHD